MRKHKAADLVARLSRNRNLNPNLNLPASLASAAYEQD
jgi:hypothetical protein